MLQREKLPELNDNDEERLDEQPVVVVLKSGDLSAQEAENEKKRIKAGNCFQYFRSFSVAIYLLF